MKTQEYTHEIVILDDEFSFITILEKNKISGWCFMLRQRELPHNRKLPYAKKQWWPIQSEIEGCIHESINEALLACMHAKQNRVDHASADTTSADTRRFF